MSTFASFVLLFLVRAVEAGSAYRDWAPLAFETEHKPKEPLKSLATTLLSMRIMQGRSDERLTALRLQPSIRSPVAHMSSDSGDLDKLLKEHADKLNELRPVIAGAGDDYDDLFLLRFVLENPDDLAAAKAAASAAMEWRSGEGKPIVEAAKAAFAEATAGGGWNNAAAFERAPHVSAISKFIGPEGSQIHSVPLGSSDLAYVIRASAIDDKGLMNAVSVEQLIEFFLYVKELNSLVCNAKTLKTRQLAQIIAVNDLGGRSGLSGDFQKALSRSSKQAAKLYPLLGGPTLLLNLPILLSFLVKLLKPLFPKSVQTKLRFENGPLSDLTDLKNLRDAAPRAKFISEISALLAQ